MYEQSALNSNQNEIAICSKVYNTMLVALYAEYVAVPNYISTAIFEELGMISYIQYQKQGMPDDIAAELAESVTLDWHQKYLHAEISKEELFAEINKKHEEVAEFSWNTLLFQGVRYLSIAGHSYDLFANVFTNGKAFYKEQSVKNVVKNVSAATRNGLLIYNSYNAEGLQIPSLVTTMLIYGYALYEALYGDKSVAENVAVTTTVSYVVSNTMYAVMPNTLRW